jgi:hypothetical protein
LYEDHDVEELKSEKQFINWIRSSQDILFSTFYKNKSEKTPSPSLLSLSSIFSQSTLRT